jgi:hypothetical protein
VQSRTTLAPTPARSSAQVSAFERQMWEQRARADALQQKLAARDAAGRASGAAAALAEEGGEAADALVIRVRELEAERDAWLRERPALQAAAADAHLRHAAGFGGGGGAAAGALLSAGGGEELALMRDLSMRAREVELLTGALAESRAELAAARQVGRGGRGRGGVHGPAQAPVKCRCCRRGSGTAHV